MKDEAVATVSFSGLDKAVLGEDGKYRVDEVTQGATVKVTVNGEAVYGDGVVRMFGFSLLSDRPLSVDELVYRAQVSLESKAKDMTAGG